MASRTKLAIALTVATASVFSLASSALAQTAVDVVEGSENGAIAVLIHTDVEDFFIN